MLGKQCQRSDSGKSQDYTDLIRVMRGHDQTKKRGNDKDKYKDKDNDNDKDKYI